jgi:phosphatidylserine/phosphatidylglycerophosphate/cardiolipin synthase-like enzyme
MSDKIFSVGTCRGIQARTKSKLNNGKVFHVKCAVADGEWLFLSSANLTQQAFTINMELGMLVRGGTMPSEQIETRIRFRVIEKCQRRPSTFFSLKLSV